MSQRTMQMKAPGTQQVLGQCSSLNRQAACCLRCTAVALLHAYLCGSIKSPLTLAHPLVRRLCFCSGDRLGKGPSLSPRCDVVPPRPCLAGAGPACQQQPQNKPQRSPRHPPGLGLQSFWCSLGLFTWFIISQLLCLLCLPSLCGMAWEKGGRLSSACLCP